MVVLRGRPIGSSGAGEGLGSESRAGQLDEQAREFILSNITRCILDQTLLIFISVKEGISKVLEEQLSLFRSEMMAIAGARSLIFRDFRACGAP